MTKARDHRDKPDACSRVIEAEAFIVRDHQGRRRASLGLGPDGSVALNLFAGIKKSGISLRVEPGGDMGISFRSPTGKITALLALCQQRGSYFGLFNAKGRARISTECFMDGRAEVAVRDGSGRRRAAIRVRPDGTPEWIFSEPLRGGGCEEVAVKPGSPLDSHLTVMSQLIGMRGGLGSQHAAPPPLAGSRESRAYRNGTRTH